MRNYVDAGSFILIVKTLKGINANTPVKCPTAKDDWAS
ncbi:hypothetical protein H500_00645 [Helicobacter pylori CG-IMSS-2012]|nr:hypothetical protein H500_00645 [Helicobacter pylori CG-IMSS-2012]